MADSADYATSRASWHGRAALPAGQISSPTGPRNEIGMAGYVWSPKAGIYCVRYRYYDPLLGRWLQRDPAGYVDGLNLYTYGLGNPWMHTDPYGLFVGLFIDGAVELWDIVWGNAAGPGRTRHTHGPQCRTADRDMVPMVHSSPRGRVRIWNLPREAGAADAVKTSAVVGPQSAAMGEVCEGGGRLILGRSAHPESAGP